MKQSIQFEKGHSTRIYVLIEKYHRSHVLLSRSTPRTRSDQSVKGGCCERSIWSDLHNLVSLHFLEGNGKIPIQPLILGSSL